MPRPGIELATFRSRALTIEPPRHVMLRELVLPHCTHTHGHQLQMT